MAINLEKGISLKIEGELGKYQTLPVDSLIEIAKSLEQLLMSVAKYDLPTNEAVDLNNFKIELTDFQKSSAVPSFVFTQRVQTVVGSYENQRAQVTKKMDALLNISSKGNYEEIASLYPEYHTRNPIVESLYNFTSSFQNSPVSIYEKGGNEDNGYVPKKFKSSVKKGLIVDVKKIDEKKTEEEVFAIVKQTQKGTKTTSRIKEVFSIDKHSLSYSPKIIKINQKQYLLHFPLRCLIEKEDNHYNIINEQLDIFATGLTIEEAEQDFNEDFDYLYERLNSLEENQLNKRLSRVKVALNSFVKQVY